LNVPLSVAEAIDHRGCALLPWGNLFISRLILREQLRRRSPPRLILEIDIRERLSVVVADDEAGGLFLDEPRWREVARGGHVPR
jgi:hypothetical protein